MLQIISMLLALIAVVMVNSAANTSFITDHTSIELLNRLPMLFIPANYVFFVSPFIYAFLTLWIFGFAYKKSRKDHAVLNVRMILFIVSAIFKIIWILLWQYEYFDWSIAALAVLLAILTALYFTYPKYENNFWQRMPISCYFGWTIFAFITNVNYILTLHEWSGWGLSTDLWTVVFLTFATAIALHFLYHYRDLPLNIMFMWAFVGIAVKNGFDALFVSSASLFLTAVIGVGLILIKNKNFISPS